MANIATKLNDTLSIANYSSPIASSTISADAYGNTTTAVVVYAPHTYLTPWPVFVASLILSLSVLGWGVFSSTREVHKFFTSYTRLDAIEAENMISFYSTSPKDSWSEDLALPKSSAFKLSCDAIAVLISTLRSLAALISGTNAFFHPGTVRFRSPIATFMLFFPLLSWSYDTTRHTYVRMLMLTNAIMVFFVFHLMLVARILPGSNFYSAYRLAGGNDPRAVVDCIDPRRPDGTGQPKSLDTWGKPNTIASMEFVVALILDVGGLLGVFLGMSLIWTWFKIIYRCLPKSLHRFCHPGGPYGFACSRCNNWVGPSHLTLLNAQLDFKLDRSSADSLDFTFKTHPLSRRQRHLEKIFYIAIVVTIIALLSLYIDVKQQQNPDTVTVIDGKGCFEIKPVHDRSGFAAFWWNEAKSKPLEWLSLT